MVQLEFRADHDHGTPGIIDTLAQEVLTEPASLALEHVTKRFQRAVRSSSDGTPMSAVVEQGIDSLLQHPLFVPDDDFWGFQLQQGLQAIVAVDHATIEIVQIGGRKAATFKWNERTQVRRNNRKHVEHHPFRTGLGVHKALHELESLGQLLAQLLAARRSHLLFDLVIEILQIGLLEKLLNGFCAHACDENVAVLILGFAKFCFRQQLAFLQRSVARIDDDVILVVDDPFELPAGHVEHQSNARRHTLVEPDVGNRNGQIDVAHPLSPNAAEGYLDATSVANHSLVLNALVLAARAFPITRRAEDALAKKPTFFRLERPIVDGLGILDLSLAPAPDTVGRGDRNGHLIESDRTLFSKNFANIDFFHMSRALCATWLGCRLGEDGLLAAHTNVEAKSLHLLNEDVE